MKYTVRAHGFDGPFDLLLSLIEERKLPINEISLAEVTQGFFSYLQTLEGEVLESRVTFHELTEFLRVASTLILIKSKSLLPGFHVTDDEERDVTDLTSRLEELARFRELSDSLRNQLSHPKSIYNREAFATVEATFLPPRNLHLSELPPLLRILLGILPVRESLPEKKIEEIVSMEEKIAELEKRIEAGLAKSFSEFLGEKREKTHVIVSFLALLELVKIGVIAAKQDRRFGNIAMGKLKP